MVKCTVNLDVSFRDLLPQINNGELKVLIALGTRVNGERATWPSMAKIAQDTGLGRGAVQYAITKLEKRGLIKVQRHIENNRRRNSYLVNNYFEWGHNGHGTTKPASAQLDAPEEIVQNRCSVLEPGTLEANLSYIQPVCSGTQLQQATDNLQGRIDIEELLPNTSYLDKEKSLSSVSTDIETDVLPEKPVVKPIPEPQATECPAAVPRVPATGATAAERGEFIAADKNKPAALYFALCHLIPKAKLPWPGGGAKCPGIGRLGRMSQLYGGWAVVHQQIEYAALDVQFGKAAGGDILSWIEGRLKGRVSGKTIRGHKLPTNEQLAQSWRGIAVSDEET